MEVGTALHVRAMSDLEITLSSWATGDFPVSLVLPTLSERRLGRNKLERLGAAEE